MYKLMIVEDDPVILNRLKTNFDWESLGFAVCGTAGDGLSALRLIPALLPDVVLTDVEMPAMSGLELAKQIPYPAKMVFLSAYDDFRYAREAFRLGAVDYLLKPLHQEDVTKLFLKIAKDLTKERQEFPQAQPRQSTKRDSFRQVILDFLLGQTADPDRIALLLQHFGLNNSGKYTLAAFCFTQQQSLDTIQAALGDFCAGKPFIPLVFPHQYHFVLLLPDTDRNAAAFMTEFLAKESGWQCVISRHSPLSNLPQQFAQLWNHPCGWFYYPKDDITFLSGGNLSEKSLVTTNELPGADHYFSTIKDRNQSRFLHLLNTQAQMSRRQQIDVDLCMIHMAQTYVKTAAQLQSFQPKLPAESFSNLFRQFQGCFCFQDLDRLYQDYMKALMENYTQLSDQKGDLIYLVQNYIREHYAENLTLAELSGKFYVSASYLSSLYSQRTNMTITEFLQQVRMEQAALLLRETNLSVAEIGSAVGYGNYKNFWKLFKRHFNLTPKDYRTFHNA